MLDRSLDDELKQEYRKYFPSKFPSIGVSSFCYVRQPGAFHNWLLNYVIHQHTITSRPRSNQCSHRNPLGMGGQQTMSQISLKYKQCGSAPNLTVPLTSALSRTSISGKHCTDQARCKRKFLRMQPDCSLQSDNASQFLRKLKILHAVEWAELSLSGSLLHGNERKCSIRHPLPQHIRKPIRNLTHAEEF